MKEIYQSALWPAIQIENGNLLGLDYFKNEVKRALANESIWRARDEIKNVILPIKILSKVKGIINWVVARIRDNGVMEIYDTRKN